MERMRLPARVSQPGGGAAVTYILIHLFSPKWLCECTASVLISSVLGSGDTAVNQTRSSALLELTSRREEFGDKQVTR